VYRRLPIAVLIVAASACKRDRPSPAPAEPVAVKSAVAPDAGPPPPEMVPVTWPAGDATAGRAAFVRHRCFGCHIVMLDDELSQMHRDARGHDGHGMGHAVHGQHGAVDDGPVPQHAVPQGHDLPPPLNSATTNKPGLLLARQIVMPGDVAADHAVHYGAYADAITVGELTDLVAFLTQVARSEVAKPETMSSEDLDLVWPSRQGRARRRRLSALSRRGRQDRHIDTARPAAAPDRAIDRHAAPGRGSEADAAPAHRHRRRFASRDLIVVVVVVVVSRGPCPWSRNFEISSREETSSTWRSRSCSALRSARSSPRSSTG
jgi:hypothetical protein